MNKNINFITFGTFGSPNGFTQTLLLNKPNLDNNIKHFDIRSHLLVSGGGALYSIRKELQEPSKIISYAIYTYAQEPSSARNGSFIGSGIMFTDSIANENLTVHYLNKLHNNVISNYVKNDIITVKHSNEIILKQLEGSTELNNNLKKIETINLRPYTNKFLLVYTATTPQKLEQLFKKAIDLLDVYDTIYFTSSEVTAQHAKKRGVFKFLQSVNGIFGFELEHENFLIEKQRMRTQKILEFEEEIKKINANKEQTITQFKKQIETYEKVHLENENKIKESKRITPKINEFYDKLINSLNQLIKALNNDNADLESIKQTHNQNKIAFNNAISQLSPVTFITAIPTIKPKGELVVESQNKQSFQNPNANYSQNVETKKKINIDIWKVISFLLIFLIILSFGFFFVVNYNNASNKTKKETKDGVALSAQTQPIVYEELQPKPNDTLNSNDYRNVAKKIAYNTTIDAVVKTIFKANPKQIGDIYSTQVVLYAKKLQELNTSCFSEKSGTYYFTRDTIKQIPSFK